MFLTRPRGRARRTAAAFVVPLVSAVTLVGLPGSASGTVVATASWNAPLAGASECSGQPVTVPLVTCDHSYTSRSVLPDGRPAETCFTGGVVVAAGPARADSCHAELAGTTAGPGYLVNEDVAVCETTGVNTFSFSITTPLGPFSMPIRVVHNTDAVTYVQDVAVVYDGRQVKFVQEISGSYTGGCGLPGRAPGTFSGIWKLTVA